MVSLNNDWDGLLKDEFKKDYYLELREFLKKEYRTQTIYPDMYKIFSALKHTACADVKVVILGQDPYHGPNQAHGMCFSVQPGIALPPSLVNIFKELESDLGCKIPNNGYLVPWADQGVLLLNTVLTVRAGQANSHKNMGWEIFTDRIIEIISAREKPLVFLLWGAPAKQKLEKIDVSRHIVFSAPHPSPLSASRGFFGCRHFSKANETLKSMGETPLDWQIPNIHSQSV
jgi:uracil-DNA glycosylase